MKTNQKIILTLIIGFIIGHLFGFRDPLPLDTAVKDVRIEIVSFYKQTGELPTELKNFTSISETELKHDDFEITYNSTVGSITWEEPWLYRGFLRRLTFGKSGRHMSRNGHTRHPIPKEEIESLNEKQN